MNLEEIYTQIDTEAEEAALVYPCSAGDDEPLPRPQINGVRKAYFIKGATPYAEKWHEEKELRERYEKALRRIGNMSELPDRIKWIINEALTPKPSTDEQ